MLRLLCAMCLSFVVFSAFCQSGSEYQVATIVDVKTHPVSGNDASDIASYDVSIRVGDTIYLVLYTPPFGIDTVKYKAGRNLLVLVGKNKIRYNDILGQSLEVPIISKKSD